MCAQTVDWTDQELLQHIEEICTGEQLVQIDCSPNGLDLFVVFRYPTKELIRMAEIQERKATSQAVQDKILNEEQMMKHILENRIWTERDDSLVSDLRKQIGLREKKIADPEVAEDAKVWMREALTKLRAQLYAVESKKELMLAHTVERLARQAKYDFLVWVCSYDPFDSQKRVWKDYLTYCQTVDDTLKLKLLSRLISFLDGHPQDQLRYVARSNTWRMRYVCAAKGNMPIFSGSVDRLTPDQLHLVWWSGYYENIWSMMPDDQPDDVTIQDDELLDTYMEELYKKRSSDRTLSRSERSGGNTAMGMKEVIVTKAHPDYHNLAYDKAPTTKDPTKTDIPLSEDTDPANERRQHLKAKAIKGTKRFIPNQ
jgi:hypothetical protein